MSKVMYHHALDEHDRLVCIDKVEPESRHSHRYRCLSCGAELVPRLGKVRSWHFAHSCGDEHCGTETYLHRLAKQLIREKFERDGEFTIGYYQDVVCADFRDCPFAQAEECHLVELRYFDLKKYYDTCREEQPVGEYVADLLLSSSANPGREPVLIEIHVTHKSSEEKCQSGLCIIEISIRTEEDIIRLLASRIEESEPGCCRRTNDAVSIKFHGFKEEANSPLENRQVQRFLLYPSGKAHISECVLCRKAMKKKKGKAVFEVALDGSRHDKFSLYKFGYAVARMNGVKARTCEFCQNYRSGYGRVPYCSSHRVLDAPENPEPQYAVECSNYQEDNKKIMLIESMLPPYMIVE